MNKKELVAAIAERTHMTKKDAGKILDAIIDIIEEKLAGGEVVRLVGFGTFSVVKRKPRKGVNPRTKEPIKIPGGKVPKFIPGKELKDKVK
ncbi:MULTISPECIES: HU family DNA-binding protein [Kosmotoga]|uniref:Histone family protein DNA-binding protein n=1 Tax=Kosmotoga olearia (strain ATCC BAA-1733 / DSM 21960 / TBF 19.5.1) TaxID=521045 RepID=C5CDN8_KOSOT|nr:MULTISPECIES: HU family DNA-binding protein [Kosmotoga]ACR80050.1 histone family protein DNA-binding protein [Kosmotoga olearia TBF 19.5.1]MDI3524420.1 DNA-binding protein HU-beta [Kosmotoga sp.]MDK2954280.1 DNA-binding protein HU-beta [Kosmotoga sp.]OAA20487.1 integration host factor [Kosmotoga sp. DU53]